MEFQSISFMNISSLDALDFLFQLKDFTSDYNESALLFTCIALDYTPVPGAGSACDLIVSIQKDSAVDIALSSAFLTLDLTTFGMAKYAKIASKSKSSNFKIASETLSTIIQKAKKSGILP